METVNNEQIVNKSMGRSHMAPSEYTYVIKCYISDSGNLLLNLKYENCSNIGNFHDPSGPLYFVNGHNFINNIDIWVVDQGKQGVFYFWFKNKNEAVNLFAYLDEKKKIREHKKVNSVYRYHNTSGWKNISTYYNNDPNNLVGYDHYLQRITTDVDNYIKYIDFLNSVGEGNRTINYVSYGPPGTGKTTFIKTFASINDYPIFIVNPSVMNNSIISNVLNPKVSTKSKIKILLFEDFDRYLKDDKFSMSEILNELDGVETTEPCIRYFTCNDLDEIKKHDALINRINFKFKFDYPSIDIFSQKLDKLLSFYNDVDPVKKHEFLELWYQHNETNKITLRPFISYVIRYLFDENYLDKMIKNIKDISD